MKTIKTAFFLLVVLFVGTSIITSCSKEEGVAQNSKVTSYLKSFYSEDFHLGASANSNIVKESSSLSSSKSTEVEGVVVTEVFVGGDERARGYIITNKETNDFLYFIDVDRINEKMTTSKIETNETKVFRDINELDRYLATDKFDYIKIAEDYASGNSSVAERRFWGWGPMFGGPCENGMRVMFHTYYVLGIGVDTDPIPDGDGHGVLREPCGPSVLGEE